LQFSDGLFRLFSLFHQRLQLFLQAEIKERIPQPPLEASLNIKIWDGMFGVMRNKYKWTLTIVGLLTLSETVCLRYNHSVSVYLRLSGLAYSLIFALVSFAGTPPDFFTPYFIMLFS
jgi:hypothetical protein